MVEELAADEVALDSGQRGVEDLDGIAIRTLGLANSIPVSPLAIRVKPAQKDMSG
jgi:hypothetical protein